MLPTALPTSMALFREASGSLLKISILLKARPQLRFSSNNCGSDDEIKENRKDLEEDFPSLKKYAKPVSMWENPKCCKPICDVIRHDILYLTEKPKKYTRTWVEATEIEKMVYDCSGKIEPPEIMPRSASSCGFEKKDPSRCPRCEGNENKLGLMQCKPRPVLDGSCPKIRLPCCGKVRDPPVCSKVVKHTCCQKRCTMYPAYSECKRDKPPARHPVECFCLRVPSMCEVYAQFRKFALK